MLDLAVIALAHARHPALATAGRQAPQLLIVARQAAAWLSAVLLPGRRPGVSVITPTWQRHDLLLDRCIPSVRGQTWQGTVEHVIVSDGPDPVLAAALPGIASLGLHRPERNGGVTARNHGLFLASQPLIAYLDDDNSWRASHLERVAGALLESGADFAYSRAACHADGLTWTIGCSPPAYAQVDTSLIVHRRGLLALGGWQRSEGPADWDLVRRWLAAGATWAFVPCVTLDYFAQLPAIEASI